MDNYMRESMRIEYHDALMNLDIPKIRRLAGFSHRLYQADFSPVRIAESFSPLFALGEEGNYSGAESIASIYTDRYMSSLRSYEQGFYGIREGEPASVVGYGVLRNVHFLFHDILDDDLLPYLAKKAEGALESMSGTLDDQGKKNMKRMGTVSGFMTGMVSSPFLVKVFPAMVREYPWLISVSPILTSVAGYIAGHIVANSSGNPQGSKGRYGIRAIDSLVKEIYP